MISVESAEIIEIKVFKTVSEVNVLEYIPNKSIYDGSDKGKKFAIFKYGGTVLGWTFLCDVKVRYKTNLSKEETKEKLEEFAYDLREDIMIEQVIESIPKTIF